MKRLHTPALLALAMIGCGGGGGGAAVDAPVGSDGPVVDGPCGSLELYTGEYVDWDSSDANFLGIFDATVTAGSAGSSTPPNGRFRLCIQTTDDTATLTPAPGSGSAEDYLPGVAVIDHAIVDSGVTISMRSFTQTRMTSMFSAIGSSFDANAGQLFVHTNNASTATLSIDAASATPFAFGPGETWGSGSAGTYVFFPNVDISAAVTLSASFGSAMGGSNASGTLTGTGNLGTLPAGKFFYVEVSN